MLRRRSILVVVVLVPVLASALMIGRSSHLARSRDSADRNFGPRAHRGGPRESARRSER